MACSITCKNNFLDIFILVVFPKVLRGAKKTTNFYDLNSTLNIFQFFVSTYLYFQFCIFFVDHVSRYSLSREALEKHKKRRQKRDDETNRLKHVERQEELAKKKEEERKEEHQRMEDEQDPEKQKRMYEKIKQKEKKRETRKTMKMKQMKIRT